MVNKSVCNGKYHTVCDYHTSMTIQLLYTLWAPALGYKWNFTTTRNSPNYIWYETTAQGSINTHRWLLSDLVSESTTSFCYTLHGLFKCQYLSYISATLCLTGLSCEWNLTSRWCFNRRKSSTLVVDVSYKCINPQPRENSTKCRSESEFFNR